MDFRPIPPKPAPEGLLDKFQQAGRWQHTTNAGPCTKLAQKIRPFQADPAASMRRQRQIRPLSVD